MKNKNIIIIASAIILLCCMISSCSELTNTPSSSTASTDSTDASAERIEELEAQIVMLMQNQHLSEKERKEEIAALKAEIEKLKNDKPADGNASGTGSATDSSEIQRSFTYTLENGRAVITKITTTESSIVIPSAIDGYSIYAIGTEAISSPTLKSVVISSGIEKIDWFAFKNCVALSSITIPDTVSSIGYGAFDNTSRSFTISCVRDSFAHKYAQSYGFAYNIT